MSGPNVLLKITELRKNYWMASRIMGATGFLVSAVKNISLNIFSGECLALVGESGCGKTTFGRCLLRLVPADSGKVIYRGRDLLRLPEREFRRLQPEFQMIYQNHTQALNPRQSVDSCLREPLRIHGKYPKASLRRRVEELLSWVGLSAELMHRFPNELSGGQRQRVAIARALATSPRFIIADEPTSSLDASMKRQIVDLLLDLRHRFGLTLLLISHDLAMVAHASDRIAVMYKGEVVELAPTNVLVRSPVHPYSKLLVQSASYDISSASSLDYSIAPEAENRGCAFTDRCPWAEAACLKEKPRLGHISDEHLVACHLEKMGYLDSDRSFSPPLITESY